MKRRFSSSHMSAKAEPGRAADQGGLFMGRKQLLLNLLIIAQIRQSLSGHEDTGDHR
jgi:hypothetical protein